MKGKFFAFTSRLKYINRWALMRNTTYENLSQHSGEVATIAHALAVIGNKRLGKEYNAERAALLGLYHDTPEIITGDMPTPVKYYSSEMRSVSVWSKRRPAKGFEYAAGRFERGVFTAVFQGGTRRGAVAADKGGG